MGIFDKYVSELDRSNQQADKNFMEAELERKKTEEKKQMLRAMIAKHLNPVCEDCFKGLPELVRSRSFDCKTYKYDKVKDGIFRKEADLGIIAEYREKETQKLYRLCISSSGVYYLGRWNKGIWEYERREMSYICNLFIHLNTEKLFENWRYSHLDEEELRSYCENIPRVIINNLHLI